MRILLLFLLFCFWVNITNAKKIGGHVIDSQNGQAISYVNIKITGCNSGGITNKQGFFDIKIPKDCQCDTIKISHVGYKTIFLSIKKDFSENSIVKLKREPTILGEVTIVSEDTLLALIKRAYKKIPNNYPDFPTRFTGFFRKTNRLKDGPYLEFMEAVIQGYKTSYTNKSPGQIKILKSRKRVFSAKDTVMGNVMFYGGPFIPHYADVVHEKFEFINPRHFNNYRYKLENELDYDNRRVYRIRFSPINSDKAGYSGVFLLDKERQSFIEFNYDENEKVIAKRNSLNFTPLKYVSRTAKVTYYEYNEKCYINSIRYNSILKNRKTNKIIESSHEFITTSVKFQDAKAIPFEEQLGFRDIYIDIAENYSESYWKDYTILEQHKSVEPIISLQFSTEQSKQILTQTDKKKRNTRKWLIDFAKRMRFDYGLMFQSIDIPFSDVNIQYTQGNNEILLSNNDLQEKLNLTTFYQSISFMLKDEWYLNYKDAKSITYNPVYSKSSLFGLSKIFCVKPGGKQYFFESGISYFSEFCSIFVDELNNNTMPLDFAGKTMDSKRIAFYAGVKEQGICPEINLKTNLKGMLHFVIGAGYRYGLRTSDLLFVQEKTGIFRKKIEIPLGDSNIIYNEGYNTMKTSSISTNNWIFHVGVRIDL